MKFGVQSFSEILLLLLALLSLVVCHADGALRRQRQNASPPKRSLIVSGTSADNEDYPYFARAGRGSTAFSSVLCGASLIHPDILLTAAHCHGAFNYEVLLYDPDDEEFTRSVQIDEQRRHPNYNIDNTLLNYDVLVLRLTEPVFDIEPVVLNNDPTIPSVDQELIAIGFGSTEHQGERAEELQEGEFVYVSKETCIERMTIDNIVRGIDFDSDDYLCVDPEDDDSVCSGDSGGPLVTKSGVQVGVSSFTVGCEDDDKPDGFARVSFFHDWIQEKICEISNVKPDDCPGPSPPNPYEVNLRLEFLFDFDAHEITFAIRNRANGEIEYAGPYFVPSQGSYHESFLSLLPGAYTMEVYDNFKGDGLIGRASTLGSWGLYATDEGSDEEVEIATGNAFFRNLQLTEFSVDGGSSVCPLDAAIPVAYDPSGTRIFGSTEGMPATVPNVDGCSVNTFSPTIWYKFTTDSQSRIAVTTCSPNTSFDTVVAVYREVDETQCNFVCEGGNDDWHFYGDEYEFCSHSILHSVVVIESQPPGDTFYVAVSGYEPSAFGTFELFLLPIPEDPPPPDPPADSCPLDLAIPLPYEPKEITSVLGSTIGATPTLPLLIDGCRDGSNSPTVWYKLETDFNDIVNITTCSVGTNFDTVITIFVGDPGTCNLACLRSNDDHGTDLSQCSGRPWLSHVDRIALLAGIPFYIAVSGFSTYDAGLFELQLIPNDIIILPNLGNGP